VHARGIEAVGRLVEHKQRRLAEQRPRQAKPLAHPERVRTRRPARGGTELDELEDLLDPRRGQLRGDRERPQVVASRAGGMKVVGLEHRPDPTSRALELGETTAEDERLARRRRCESQQQSQRRRLARPVRTEEAGHGARRQRERKLVDGDHVAVALGQRAHTDHRIATAGVDRDQLGTWLIVARHAAPSVSARSA
jgi:hypothetical protein